MIVHWGLASLPEACAEAGVSSPLLVASPRWDSLELPVEPAAHWREVPSDRISEAVAEARGGDGVLAVGGGSAIDLGKAISGGTGLPLVSVPTTYAGAEWTSYFGVRDPGRSMRGGGGGARLAAIVYEPELTLGLPAETTVGTSMNALAHCAEALYVQGHNRAADEHGLSGARLIAEWLPRVVAAPEDLEARTQLLRGACHGGAALAGSMLALAHAMAQALGGRYGAPHGALNAVCLPPALRFNAEAVPAELARFAEAIGADDAADRAERLARRAGYERLRDLGVSGDDLPEVAERVVERPGANANPRPVDAAAVESLLRSVF